jgi:hypothetical protein
LTAPASVHPAGAALDVDQVDMPTSQPKRGGPRRRELRAAPDENVIYSGCPTAHASRIVDIADERNGIERAIDRQPELWTELRLPS